MITVEKKKGLLLERYEIILISVLIIVGLLGLIFISTNNYHKTISELYELKEGNYYISGFVSDVKIYENFITFKLSDDSSEINAIAHETVINNSDLISGYCNLKTYNKKLECLFKKDTIKITP